MSIVESDRPPSWSLDAIETGESTKCPWLGEMGLKAWGREGKKIFLAYRALHHPYPRVFCTLPNIARVKRPRWRPVGLNDRHLRSHGKIGDREQSIDRRTVCKKTLLETWFSLRSCPKPEHPIRSFTFLETNHFSQSKRINVLPYLLIQTPK